MPEEVKIFRHIKLLILPVLISIVVFSMTTCKTEGPGGKATIRSVVKHDTILIPVAIVYIKYGAEKSPGTDPSDYDDSRMADSLAKVEFNGLQKGDYFLYAVGYDSAVSSVNPNVFGSITLRIRKRSETIGFDITVFE